MVSGNSFELHLKFSLCVEIPQAIITLRCSHRYHTMLWWLRCEQPLVDSESQRGTSAVWTDSWSCAVGLRLHRVRGYCPQQHSLPDQNSVKLVLQKDRCTDYF